MGLIVARCEVAYSGRLSTRLHEAVCLSRAKRGILAEADDRSGVLGAEAARVLDINSPAGFEEFIAAAGRPAESLTLPPSAESPPDLEQLTRAAAAHGIELLGPPGTLP